MRISDWSSDVCSSDLLTRRFPDRADHARALPPIARSLHGGVDDRLGGRETWVGVVLLGGVLQEQLGKPFLARRGTGRQDRPFQRADGALKLRRLLRIEIGRASWRERVCQYVSHLVVAVSLTHISTATRAKSYLQKHQKR